MEKTKTEKGLNAKKSIYDTAIKLMNSQGYENVSISDICKSAGFSVGNFYYYYKSKVDILVEYVHLHNEELLEYHNSLANHIYIDRIKMLTLYAMEKKDQLGKDFVAKLFAIDFMDKNLLMLSSHVYFKIICELVEKAQENNEITKKLSTKDISDLLINNNYGLLASWLYTETRYSLKEAAEKNLDILLGFLVV
ncbi:TetR/AcrR family transcriptional regulator [Anaerosolibacter carboniphilus]|nr:TetR/AcrR family transcriptional regulator [Anaerosolibacter carboniphilus]